MNYDLQSCLRAVVEGVVDSLTLGLISLLLNFSQPCLFNFAKGKKEQTINFNGDLCTNIEADNIQKLN